MNKYFTFLTSATLSLTLFISCSRTSAEDQNKPIQTTNPAPPTSNTENRSSNKNDLSVLAYNVENLFDTVHDQDREDWEYLPKAVRDQTPEAIEWCNTNALNKNACLANDWNDDVLKEKLKRIVSTILSAKDQGPDVVMVEEVENLNVLSMLANALSIQTKSDYTPVLIEGDDKRGIDVGLLTKKKVLSATLHRIPFSEKARGYDENQNLKSVNTRGILETIIGLENGKKLHVFGGHFPSQRNPSIQRQEALAFLAKLVNQVPSTDLVLAGGDLNITKEEEASLSLFSNLSQQGLSVSHLVGMKDQPGSYYHQGAWVFLDAFIFPNRALDSKSEWSVNLDSMTVKKAGEFQLNLKGTPLKFKPNIPHGVSDHLPIYIEMKY
jgi:endonuclease/exonuclease/phosphatase family metal-dependent hydrolase